MFDIIIIGKDFYHSLHCDSWTYNVLMNNLNKNYNCKISNLLIEIDSIYLPIFLNIKSLNKKFDIKLFNEHSFDLLTNSEIYNISKSRIHTGHHIINIEIEKYYLSIPNIQHIRKEKINKIFK